MFQLRHRRTKNVFRFDQNLERMKRQSRCCTTSANHNHSATIFEILPKNVTKQTYMIMM